MAVAKNKSIELETGWSDELLYQLLENVKDYAITAQGLDGRTVAWNVGAERIFQYTPEEALGMDAALLFTEEDRANKIPEAEMRTAVEKGCAEDERWHLRKDGSLFFASGIMTPLYKEGIHVGYAKIARDLTERVIAFEELRKARESVDAQVEERTGEIRLSYEALKQEVIERSEAERLRAALIHRIVRVQEDERKRIARDIHDNIGQQMTALQINLKMLLERFAGESEIFEALSRLHSIANQVDSEVDFLAWELRPSVLDDLGLEPAAEKYADQWGEHFGIPIEFGAIKLEGQRFLPEIEINLYRVLQEALNNVAKHAKATSVTVLLEKLDHKLSLIVEDDGIGFDLTGKATKPGEDRCLGLVGMRERAELIGGSLVIESGPGKGTSIFARVPARIDSTQDGEG